VNACECVQDRSDVPYKAVPLGCAQHFSEGDDNSSASSGLKTSAEICYVKGGISCTQNALSDFAMPDTAWRSCSQDCFGLGSSFAPETRVACGCFNETKPGTPHTVGLP
jgi:hypothetical protein